ncbi:MAG TPA: DUF3307 domain-containing protein [Candidatus Krumholzibacteria bacterium]|nr:DUF3307 domain-containing protein [Candidatus Krumholzibacteria bacterium]
MTVLESLLLAHLLGDWILQTNWQAVNKRHNWRAMLSHVVVYHAVVLAVLGARFGFENGRVYAVVAGLAISHAFLDRVWPVEWLMKRLGAGPRNDSDRWLTVMFDQSIHILLLGLATLILSPRVWL